MSPLYGPRAIPCRETSAPHVPGKNSEVALHNTQSGCTSGPPITPGNSTPSGSQTNVRQLVDRAVKHNGHSPTAGGYKVKGVLGVG